jgi:hypothetical protein
MSLGKVGLEEWRIEGREMSAARRRVLAVAMRELRDRWVVEPGGVRMGVRKEGCGVGRPWDVRACVSCWRVGAVAIFGLLGIMVYVWCYHCEFERLLYGLSSTGKRTWKLVV